MVEEVFIATVQPAIFNVTLLYGKEDDSTAKYVNECEEKSIVKRIRIEAAPKNLVSVKITESNDKKVVVEQAEIGSHIRYDDGIYAIEFPGRGLVVDKNQSVIVALLNKWCDKGPTLGLSARVVIEKDKLLYDEE